MSIELTSRGVTRADAVAGADALARQVLDACAQPAALIAPPASVLYRNRSARRLGLFVAPSGDSPTDDVSGLPPALTAALLRAATPGVGDSAPTWVPLREGASGPRLFTVHHLETGSGAPPLLLVKGYAREWCAHPSGELLAELYDLTTRETAVALALAEGDGIAEAAARLGLAKNTVRAHGRAVFRKLGLRTQAALATWLATALPPEEPAPIDVTSTGGNATGARRALVRTDESRGFTGSRDD